MAPKPFQLPGPVQKPPAQPPDQLAPNGGPSFVPPPPASAPPSAMGPFDFGYNPGDPGYGTATPGRAPRLAEVFGPPGHGLGPPPPVEGAGGPPSPVPVGLPVDRLGPPQQIGPGPTPVRKPATTDLPLGGPMPAGGPGGNMYVGPPNGGLGPAQQVGPELSPVPTAGAPRKAPPVSLGGPMPPAQNNRIPRRQSRFLSWRS